MKVVSRTNVGLVRNNNEDALLIKEPYLFALADGMGGHAAGEVASRAALKALEEALRPYLGGSRPQAGWEKLLEQATLAAHHHVLDLATANEEYKGMGTTLTCLCFLEPGTAYGCHIGDSRLYAYKEGTLKQISRDHTYVNELLEAGKITAQEAHVHPQRHMLLQALGIGEAIKPDYFTLPLEKGLRLLLCSDGLSDMVEDEAIAASLALPLEEAADTLLDLALSNGGSDNISLILLELEEQTNGKQNP